jgi:hypothetical protein
MNKRRKLDMNESISMPTLNNTPRNPRITEIQGLARDLASLRINTTSPRALRAMRRERRNAADEVFADEEQEE